MTATVRFVHAADLHLAAPFKGVDATDARVRDALVASTYEALEAVVTLAIERDADFVVFAGDIYNSAEKSYRAEAAFRDACVRLAETGIRVFAVHGNHDPASARSWNLELPASVHFFSPDDVERVVFERDGDGVCALYGRSYRTAGETTNLAAGFRRKRSDTLAVGVLHANVGGRPGHEPYAPCSVEDLKAARMDYWALGHIHKPEVLSADPAIVYPGSTQGLQPNDAGLRGCTFVTLTESGATTEFVPTARVVWNAAEVDLEGVSGIEEARRAIADAVSGLREMADTRPVIARLTLTGRTPVHAELTRGGALDDLRADLHAEELEREPWVWIDRLLDRTHAPLDIEAVRQGEDLAGDLVRIADALGADEAQLAALIDEVATPVLATLDRREAPEIDVSTLLERARDLALDRLLAGEES